MTASPGVGGATIKRIARLAPAMWQEDLKNGLIWVNDNCGKSYIMQVEQFCSFFG